MKSSFTRILGFALSSTANAEVAPSSLATEQAVEPQYAIAVGGIGLYGQCFGYGGLLELQRHLGHGALWARASLGGGQLARSTSGPGGGSPQDPGDGKFARGTAGIEARRASGELTVFAGVDVGYQYLGYDFTPNVENQNPMPLRSHAPMTGLRGGLELGGPRLRLRFAVEAAVYFDLDRNRAREALSAALGVAVGL